MKVAGYPRFEGVEEQDDKESLKIAAIFEVFPEVVIGDLSAQEVEKVTASVGDVEVDQTVESCANNAPASTMLTAKPKTATASSSTLKAKSTANLSLAARLKTTLSYWAQVKCYLNSKPVLSA